MVQNHRDDCAGIADLLRRSAGHDELQGMANDLHDGHLRPIRRLRQKHHHHLHQNGRRMARSQKEIGK